jgi:hypothetical protein
MAARRSAGSSQWLSAKSHLHAGRRQEGQSHCTVTGFLLGRVRARRVPFLVVARSCSGECREKNYIGRGSSHGGRGIVGGVVGCSLSGWHSKRPKQIKVSLLSSFLASFLRLHHVVVFLLYALRNCMRGPRSEFLTKTVSENRLRPMLFFPSRFFPCLCENDFGCRAFLI